MKKIILVPLTAVLAVIFLFSCLKKADPCTSYSLTQDQHIIDSAIDDNGWDAVIWDATKNIYAGNLIVGTGNMPKDDSLITFDVVTRYINGARFERVDSSRNLGVTAPQTIALKDLSTNFKGLYDVLSQMAKGGLYREIVPSSRAYGCNGNGVIPANSQLVTDVRLVDVKKP